MTDPLDDLDKLRLQVAGLEERLAKSERFAISVGSALKSAMEFSERMSEDLNQIERRLGLDVRNCPKCGRHITSVSGTCRICGTKSD